jgi:hypothetical protein
LITRYIKTFVLLKNGLSQIRHALDFHEFGSSYHFKCQRCTQSNARRFYSSERDFSVWESVNEELETIFLNLVFLLLIKDLKLRFRMRQKCGC